MTGPRRDTIPATVAEALRELSNHDLSQAVMWSHLVAERVGPALSDVFLALREQAAVEQDRRRELTDHARRELDGPDVVGYIVDLEVDTLADQWVDEPPTL